MLILAIILSYLLGSIPVGYILARLLKDIDIRRYGSGNFGATNVFRAVSPVAGVVVLVLDMLKGVIAVIVIGDFLLHSLPQLDQVLVRLSLGLAAVCGHNWTVFLKFKGGKGVATTAGALLGLSFKIPQLGLIAVFCLGVWVLVVLITGFISLASIVASLALPLFMLVFNQPFRLLIFGVVLCLFVVYRHKTNIRRLLRGEEKKVFDKTLTI
ncbi:MAG: glycerol-3-phosphate 1-O-acyltransferase PlsY [Candidatus Omnitrophica bacterium]|nr:glycerol-3-phosphate 1-O-acyltransferase PlsY [Candidatus Omnitrophota bacterium]MBU4141080.1 glycerol-3-phosphate 1-O-acyltransferase PlsY [Candidatus Omnitrophota bacterium]